MSKELDELQRVPIKDLETFKGRCKHLYKIQAKSGSTVPFEFFEAQDYFNDIVNEEFERTKKEFGHKQCRIIALKPRQVGWTTYSNIKSLDMQIQHEGSNGVIAAHDKDTTELIYRIYDRAYEELPEHIVPTLDGEDMSKRQFYKYSLSDKQLKQLDFNLSSQEFQQTHKVKIKPDTKSHTGKQIEFTDTDSITVIFTAGKGDDGGKAGTIRRIHFSEAASYSDYKDLITSINPSIPDFEDNVFFILESTANGTTGDGEGFYKAWEKATQEWERYQKGEIQTFSGFRPVFIPWYMLEEYELPLAGGKYEDVENVDFGSPEAKQNFLEREEKMLEEGIYNPLTKEHQKVTPEKINWYRWVIKKKCEFDYKKAQRYYPTTPDEAFVASSNCFFDSMKLNEVKNKRLNDGEPESELGDLVWSKEDGTLEFRPSNVGNLTVWEKPESDWDNRYVIGADIGRGYEDGDYSVAYVKDRLSQEIVACFHGKVDQDIFAEHLIELGIYYNEALLVPESNLDTVVNIIKPNGSTPYIGEIYFNETGNSVKWGYWTSSSSRQILIDKYKAWLRDNEQGYEILPDLDTIDEHLSFVRHQTAHGVKYEADEGSHDDRVIACLTPDTRIKTRYGWEKIKNLEVGQEVLTHKGRYKKITDKSKRKSDKINVINSVGKPDLKITSEHPVYSFESFTNWNKGNTLDYKNLSWKSIDDGLEKGDALTTIVKKDGYRKKKIDLLKYAPDSYKDEDGMLYSYMSHNGAINNKANPIKRYIDIDEDFCRMLGYFYAEGYAGSHLTGFASHDDEIHIRKWLSDYLEKLGLKPSIYSKYSENGSVLQVCNMPLTNYLRQLNNKENKVLPHWVENLPQYLKKEIIYGAFLGDGSFSEGYAKYATISFEGGYQLYEMLVSLGLRPALNVREGQNGNRDQIWVVLAKPDTQKMLDWFDDDFQKDKNIGDVSFKQDQTKLRFKDGYLVGKIRDISEEKYGDFVYNISVEDDESYIANGSVVHNCALTQVGDEWWDASPEEYKPNKVKELISKSPSDRRKNYLRNADLKSKR